MSEPFLGEIRMFGGNFAIRGWALCDGQLLAISQNSALFSLLGTIYGGDGETTFALPDMRSRVAIGPGNGPGLSSRTQGQRGGAEQASLAAGHVPAHTHAMQASSGAGTTANPSGAYPAAVPLTARYQNVPGGSPVAGQMKADAVGQTGTPTHPNLQPSLCITFLIALQGVFPSRN